MGWQHAIAGGQGNLVIFTFKSPNYVPGVSGWAVFRNGNAEFNNGVFRGIVTATTFEGTDFIIEAAGEFFYSAAPAPGDLIASVSNSVLDPSGNEVIPGVASYDPAVAAAALVSGALIFYKWTGSAWTSYAAFSPDGTKLALTGAPFESTGGTTITPTRIATDNWTGVTSFSNGWTNGGTCRAQMMPFGSGNFVYLDLTLTPGTITDFTTMCTLPNAKYAPAATKDVFCGTRTSAAATLGNAPFVQVTTGNTVQCVNLPANCSSVRVAGLYPLD